MFKKILSVLLLFVFLFSFFSCGTVDKNGADERSDWAKYNAYILLFEYEYEFKTIALNYFVNFGSEALPRYDDTAISIYTVNMQSINTARSVLSYEPSYAETDGYAEIMLNVMESLAFDFIEAYHYYTDEEYEKDELAKGLALHTSILEKYPLYLQAEVNFNDALHKLTDEIKSDEYEKYLNEGMLISYYSSLCLDDINDICDLFYENEITCLNANDLDESEFTPLTESFYTNVTELKKLQSDNDIIKFENINSDTLTLFADKCGELYDNLMILSDILQLKVEIGTKNPNLAEAYDGTPEKIYKLSEQVFDIRNELYN